MLFVHLNFRAQVITNQVDYEKYVFTIVDREEKKSMTILDGFLRFFSEIFCKHLDSGLAVI